MRAKVNSWETWSDDGYIEIKVDKTMLLSVLENLDIEISAELSMNNRRKAEEILFDAVRIEDKLNAQRESTENS